MLVMRALLCICLFTICSGVSEALMLDLCNLSCSCLFTVCSGVSEALMLVMRALLCIFLFTFTQVFQRLSR